uniref:Uncharacterized protein n=1 Tax=Rhizophora mucronata TaxID=61149 RepID=A0A2P2JCD5_RHIMU
MLSSWGFRFSPRSNKFWCIQLNLISEGEILMHLGDSWLVLQFICDILNWVSIRIHS